MNTRSAESLAVLLYKEPFWKRLNAANWLIKQEDNRDVWEYLWKRDRPVFAAAFLLSPFKHGRFFALCVVAALGLIYWNREERASFRDFGKRGLETRVTFDDVLGIDEFKEELVQIVDFLRHRQRYVEAGAKVPKGVLLSGPPGCGKTLLARAISCEAGVSFYSMSASQLLKSKVGASAKLINALFAKARQSPKGAIIFIDEIDTLEARSSGGGYTNVVLNTLLTAMDGFTANENIVVIGATNRPRVLDEALTRSGRFDLKIEIPLPFFENRVKVLNHYLERVRHNDSVNARELGKLTVNFSPAELKNMVNLAVLNAVKEGREEAAQSDLIAAFEKLKLGVRNRDNGSPEALQRVALKEATKAVLSIKEATLPQVNKVSVHSFDSDVAGKGIYLDKIDAVGYSQAEILGMVEFLLAGTAAEEVIGRFEEPSTVTKSDFRKASSLAYRFVGEFAFLEDFSLSALDDKYLSDASRHRLETKAEEVLNACLARARDKVKSLRKEIEAVQSELVQREQLTREEIEQILGG